MKILGFTIKRESDDSSTTSSTSSSSSASGTNWLTNITAVNNERAAMQVGAVHRCVNLISDGIAVMPLNLKYRNRPDEVFQNIDVDDPERWFYLLNVKPNNYMNGYTLKKNIVTTMLFKGNAYVMGTNSRGRVVKLNSGDVEQLVLLHDVPSYNPYTNKYTVNDTVYGINGTYSSDYILHFKNPSHDGGLLGDSTISSAIKVLSVIATGNDMQLRNFATGGRGKFVLGYEAVGNAQFGVFNDKQVQGAALDVEQQLASQDIVTLPNRGLDLKPLNFSVNDMQFSDTYKSAVEDVARFFGVPLYKITGTSSNYKTVDAAQVDFYNECLQPLCSQIECELLAKATDASCWWKFKFDFDETPLFTLDMSTKAQWMKAQMEMGVKSVNDLRNEFDIEPIEGGNEVLMSANLKTLGQLKKEGEGNPTGSKK